MRTTHRCQFCDSDYVCDTTEEVSQGVYRCQCKDTECCPGCSLNGACESCGRAPATGESPKMFFCQSCTEEWLENYEPPEPDPDPVTITELSERAHRERRELRRLD